MNTHTMERIRAGDYWVHWTYTEEEWRRFTVEAWADARRKIPLVGGCALLLAVACSLTLGLTVGTLVEGRMLLVLFLSGILAAPLLLYLGRYRLYRKRLQQTTSEVYISQWGLYRPEGTTSLANLRQVELRQRVLVLTCPTFANNQRKIEIPVPRGQQEEGRRVQQQLQAWIQNR